MPYRYEPDDTDDLEALKRWMKIKLYTDTMIAEEGMFVGHEPDYIFKNWAWDLWEVFVDGGDLAAWKKDHPSPAMNIFIKDPIGIINVQDVQ